MEPGRVVHGPIVLRSDRMSIRPFADITVWPEGGSCNQAARIHVDAATRVKVLYGSVAVDTNWTALTLGRVVTARISYGGEDSCPGDAFPVVIFVEPD